MVREEEREVKLVDLQKGGEEEGKEGWMEALNYELDLHEHINHLSGLRDSGANCALGRTFKNS